MFEKNEDLRYFNFPIQLLSGFLDNSKECLDNIFDYSVYYLLKKSRYTTFDQYREIEGYLGVNLVSRNKKDSFKNGMALYDSIPAKSPHVGIRTDILIQYYKSHKTEFEKVTLLAFLSIRSILRDKPCCKIDNKFWFSRMDGKTKSVKVLSELSPGLQKYLTEHYTRKIKTILFNDWYLNHYSKNMRGFYVSFSMNLEDLIFYAEKKRANRKKEREKKQTQEAYNKAMQRLKNGTDKPP